MGIIGQLASRFLRRKASYEGATSTRRLSSWGTSSAGPNALLESSLRSLRNRSRDLCRNNPLAESGVEAWVSNMIGTGIVPQWEIESATLKTELQQLWEDWTDEADADGVSDFYGLQALTVRAMAESGECLLRFRPRRMEDGLAVPLQLQVMEADHLD
ncbi:MAG: phage portal protein, partial [Desulfocurvibacter africanus]